MNSNYSSLPLSPKNNYFEDGVAVLLANSNPITINPFILRRAKFRVIELASVVIDTILSMGSIS